MSDRDPEQLSPAAEAAWRAFAGSISPDDGAQARVLQRVRARAQAPRRSPPIDDGDEDATGSQTARRAAAAVLVVKSSAISVGLAGGALLSIKLIAAAVHPTPTPAVPTVEIPEPPSRQPRAAEPSTRAPVPAKTEAPIEPPTTAPPVQSPAVAAHPVATRASASSEDRLQAEIDLIGRARDALHAGDTARVLELVETHRADFPAGAFVEEREAFHAIAACRSGVANGPTLAQRFATARPRSSQLAAVRAACDSVANDAMDPPPRPQ
ncbi:MAG TPA: hypothetical protein VFG69_19020 [Nannocystaceae bacterium]|nr:hypothetical protein [Nannocystaceae bacterium]